MQRDEAIFFLKEVFEELKKDYPNLTYGTYNTGDVGSDYYDDDDYDMEAEFDEECNDCMNAVDEFTPVADKPVRQKKMKKTNNLKRNHDCVVKGPDDFEGIKKRLLEAAEKSLKQGHDTPDIDGEIISPFTDYVMIDDYNYVDINKLLQARDESTPILVHTYWSIFKECPVEINTVINVKLTLEAKTDAPERFWMFRGSQQTLRQDVRFKFMEEEFPYASEVFEAIDELEDDNVLKSTVSGKFKLKSDDFFKLYKPTLLPHVEYVFVNYENGAMYLMGESDGDRHYNLMLFSGHDTDLLREMEFLEKWFEPVHTEKREESEFLYLYQNMNGLTTRSMSMDFYDPTSAFVDRNYNDDIPYEQIEEFLSGEDCGICLLHGEPGTGKSTLIKHLIAKNTDLRFIYCPASVFEQVPESEIANFMILQNKDTIYVIEDCESLISDRNRGHNHVLPTLLNFSDGIIGSALRPKFLLTFNCPPDQVDQAVLRKGRLKIMYDFKKLSLEKTRVIKPDATEPMTLADIYNDEPNGKSNEKKIGFTS